MPFFILYAEVVYSPRFEYAEYPFMQGRAFVFASQFARILSSDIAGQYVDAVIQVLGAQDISIPVKVSAVRAIRK